MKNRKNSQAASELMLILAIGFIIAVAFLVIGQKSIDTSNSELENKKAVIAAEEMIEAAELVHAQGEGSTTERYISVPENVDTIDITGNSINIILDNGNVISRTTFFNISGTINNSGGAQYITAKTLNNGLINLSSSR